MTPAHLALHATGQRTTVSLLLADAVRLEQFHPRLRYLVLVAILRVPPRRTVWVSERAPQTTNGRKAVALYLPANDIVTPLVPILGSASGALTWAIQCTGYVDLLLGATDAELILMLETCGVEP